MVSAEQWVWLTELGKVWQGVDLALDQVRFCAY